MKNIKVGSTVAFNTLKGAVWFKVEAINGFTLTVREVNTNYEPQQIDRDCVKQVR